MIDRLSRKTVITLVVLSFTSIAGYLLASRFVFRLGFPLDDAWIHQTYARNLAQFGEWSFLPGEPSAGSTGPFWGVLLSLGHILNLGPYIWTYFLGGASLLFVGIISFALFPYLCPVRKNWAIWAAVLLIFEWHLVWAAASGMETLPFSVCALLVLGGLIILGERPEDENRLVKWAWLGLGLLIGLSIWLRPDGITLLGPAFLGIAIFPNQWKLKLHNAVLLGIGFALFFGPYLVFNYQMIGSWWPTTFYAKQAEYVFLQQTSIWKRFMQQAVLPLIGLGATLLPGFGITLVKAVQKKQWGVLLVSIWMLGYLLMYAWRLPVTYQHGRYVIPMMPVFFLWSFAGLASFVQLRSSKMITRVVSKGWLLTAVCIFVTFWFIGGRAYARDVAVIESEMVTIAYWVRENTPEDALIATHDIGALGFFSDRSLLDLAGLISPETIPMLWDETHIEELMNQRDADYLVTFPGWYPTLVNRAKLIFQTETPFSPDLGGENMAIYEWIAP